MTFKNVLSKTGGGVIDEVLWMNEVKVAALKGNM
jgi:hypothetical protein